VLQKRKFISVEVGPSNFGEEERGPLMAVLVKGIGSLMRKRPNTVQFLIWMRGRKRGSI